MLLIAEVKLGSPFASSTSVDFTARLEIAKEVGDWVSIHTSTAWRGSYEHLELAREATNKPILAKGLNWNTDAIERCLFLGADYVLCVGCVPLGALDKWGDRIIYEPVFPPEWSNLTYLRQFDKIIWNARNLFTGARQTHTSFATARATHKGWLCQASLIKSPADIYPRADAVLVGTNLEPFARRWGPEKAKQGLRNIEESLRCDLETTAPTT